MKKAIVVLLIGLCVTARAGHPCAHVLICCRSANKGVTFEINGEFVSDHDYGEIQQARDILKKLKSAGIKTVIIDMTNASQWTRLWDEHEPMVNNIRKVCREEEMQYFVHIGASLGQEFKDENNIKEDAFPFWNGIAKRIWDNWAQDPEYRRYGHGDDRPILLAFQPGHMYWPSYEKAQENEKNYLGKFRIGTLQVNGVVKDPMESDGWGYRSKWQNKSGSVRLASPNGGVPPKTWYHVDAQEWEKQIRWAKEASEYSIYGSYDDTCDGFFWGIADTSETKVKHNIYPDSDNPYYYYEILRKILTND